MPFYFTCPYCFKKTLVDESVAGHSGPCANCAKLVTVPAAPDATPPNVRPVDSKAVKVVQNRNRALLLTWLTKIGVVAASLLVLGVLVAYFLWPAMSVLKTRRDRAACMINLQRIANALNEYATQYGRYPPPTVYDAKGKAMHSWRVLILPQLGEMSTYAQYNFDEPWDSPGNAELFATCPAAYISPAVEFPRTANEANYVLITGPGTVFPPSGPLAPSDIVDPLGSTLLVVESSNSSQEWTKPWDIDIQKLNGRVGAKVSGTIPSTQAQVGGNHEGGATAVFADGTPAWLPSDLAPELLRGMISPTGGEPIDASDFVPN